MTNGSKPLILVLEDDEDIRHFLQLTLRRDGYGVLLAENAAAAKNVLKQHSGVRLLILDMLLSNENGLDISREVREHPDYSHIPILMISAHPQLPSLVENGRIDDYLEKPFNLKDLELKVQALLK
jgi:DNA-binding response OmpR family regulator